MKAVQQNLNLSVTVEIDVRVWMAVAGQKLFDAERPRAMIRPDEHDISEPVSNQLYPAQDEGPHDDFAELAVGLHERQEMFTIQFDHFARLDGARS